jgi:DNA-binding MarR family transcriptional regulator
MSMTSAVELNRILHQPVRTRIMAYLIVHDCAEYLTLKRELNLSDGHMTTHMRELLEHQYVTMEKSIVNNKTKTVYHVATRGKAAFQEYVDTLRRIILHD